MRNGGAKFLVVSEVLTNLARQAATHFLHVNEGSIDAFAVAFVDESNDKAIAQKCGVDVGDVEAAGKVIEDTQGDLVLMFGGDLSAEAQAILAASAASLGGDGRRVLLHPLARYNNSVGAFDMTSGRKSVDEVAKSSNALLVGGSLQEASILSGKDFIAVQEMFLTETTEYADVVFPAASFAEADGTYTNNAGNVQRVRKAIEPLHQSKPDWMITALIAREMGFEIAPSFSASAVFRALADSTPAYEGLRYPALKDESDPVQVQHTVVSARDMSPEVDRLKLKMESMPNEGTKNTVTPRIGHKLHRVTTMTGKTPQFHLLANGNPKPENLLVSPLEQFELDGSLKAVHAEAAVVGVGDRTNPGGR